MRQFDSSRTTDIMRTVFRIRHDRAGAVQTREQYALIYKVRRREREGGRNTGAVRAHLQGTAGGAGGGRNTG